MNSITTSHIFTSESNNSKISNILFGMTPIAGISDITTKIVDILIIIDWKIHQGSSYPVTYKLLDSILGIKDEDIIDLAYICDRSDLYVKPKLYNDIKHFDNVCIYNSIEIFKTKPNPQDLKTFVSSIFDHKRFEILKKYNTSSIRITRNCQINKNYRILIQ